MRRLRLLPDLHGVPIIAVSASASAADEQRCLAGGASAFLPKPIDLDQFLREIGRLLDLAWIAQAPPPAATRAPDEPPQALIAPPEDELKVLHWLAQVGNMRSIRDHAEHIAALGALYAPFANRVRDLAERYQSQAILDLVKQVKER
jgi:CheY-like chemotaxis protein